MHGFFNRTVATPGRRAAGRPSPVPRCRVTCTLYRGCRSPEMPCTGEGRAGLFVLAEAPGAEEDRRGTQLVGESGRLLRAELAALGLDLDRDCWKMNAVNCRPPENRAPTPEELAACRPRVWEAVQERRPRAVLALGGAALSCLYGERWPGGLGPLAQWRGFCIPDHMLGCRVIPTWHPAHLLRQGAAAQDRAQAGSESRGYRGTGGRPFKRVLGAVARAYGALGKAGAGPGLAMWRRDLALAVGVARGTEPLPASPPDHGRVTLLGEEQAAEKLEETATRDLASPVAVDFETTGLKPQARGHRIVSCALSRDGKGAVAFTCAGEPVRRALARFMASPCRKIGANCKFEHAWSMECLGVEPRGWVWDCVLAAHVLDNRPGVCSVKFQAFTRLGVPHWGAEVEGYLRSTGGGANGFNRVAELAERNPRQLLLYNGMDALVEWRLAREQRRALARMEATT